MADDTTLILKNCESIREALNLLTCFEQYAGLKLNKSKTECILLGLNSINSLKEFGLKITVDPIQTHGNWISKSKEETLALNYEERVSKIRNLLNMWKCRNLTIKGKITILRSQALPLILYTASMLDIPDNILNEIDKLFFNFIWPKGKHHVKKCVLTKEI